MIDIPTALTSFKALMDIAKALKDIHDATAFNSAVIDLQEKILSAQSAQTDLIHQVSTLESEVTHLKDWKTEAQRYELKDIGQGSLAYALKPEMQGSEQSHYLCANCYTKYKKSFLQRSIMSIGRATVYRCHDCGSELYTVGHWHPDHGPRSGRR